MRLTPLILGLLAAPLLLSACTDDPPAADEAFPLPPLSAFAVGTCELAAGDVVALGGAAQRLGDGPSVGDDVREELEVAQKGLSTIADGAEPELKPLLDTLVTRAGLVRLAADGERYGPEIAEPLQESYLELVEVCTGDGPATGTVRTPTGG